MRRFLGGALGLGVALSLGGCASMTLQLQPQWRQMIGSSEMVVPITHAEIYVDVPESSATQYARTQGGLLPALMGGMIDSVKASNAAKDIAPLRDAVIDLDFASMLKEDFSQSMASNSWMHLKSLRVVTDNSTASLYRALDAPGKDGTLVATANYHLANDGGSLWIEIQAGYYVKYDVEHTMLAPGANASLLDGHQPIWKRSIWVSYSLPNASRTRAINIAVWSQNKGERLRTDMNKGVKKAAQMLAADLEMTAPPVKGVISDSDGTIDRAEDGSLTFRAGA
jgi:hypothetical protein